MTTTGQRLRMLRESRGQSQDEIAKLIGVGRTTYLKYESGENKPTRKLKELSDLFQVSSDYIMGLSDSPTFDPPPSYYNDPEAQRRMEELMNDPTRQRIFVASKNLKPEELDRIADLMETIAQSRCKD